MDNFSKCRLGFNQIGMTLVEVMISMGIMSVMVLGMSQTMNYMNKSMNAGKYKNELDSFFNRLAMYSLNTGTCKLLFEGTSYGAVVSRGEISEETPSPSTFTFVNSLTTVAGSPVRMFQVGQFLEGSKVWVGRKISLSMVPQRFKWAAQTAFTDSNTIPDRKIEVQGSFPLEVQMRVTLNFTMDNLAVQGRAIDGRVTTKTAFGSQTVSKVLPDFMMTMTTPGYDQKWSIKSCP